MKLEKSSINKFIFYPSNNYRCLHLEKMFKNEVWSFSIGQTMRKLIIMRIGCCENLGKFSKN